MTWTKRIIGAIGAFGLTAAIGLGMTHAAAIQKIYGVSVAGTITPFPASLVVACVFPTSGTCPRRAGTDKVVTTRLWGTAGSNCLVNTNSGLGGWSTCTTAIPGTGEVSITGAGDGSVIASRNQNVNVCEIYRSTDAATSWTLVFTGPVSAPCAQDASRTKGWLECVGSNCVAFSYRASNSYNVHVSNDNGATWGTPTTITPGGTTQGPNNIFWNGSQGIIVPARVSGADNRLATAAGTSWTFAGSSTFATSPTCRAGALISGSAGAVCTNATTSVLQILDSLLNVLYTTSYTTAFPNSPIPDGTMFGFLQYTSNIWYYAIPANTTSFTQIFVTTDAGISWGRMYIDTSAVSGNETGPILKLEDGSILLMNPSGSKVWKISM